MWITRVAIFLRGKRNSRRLKGSIICCKAIWGTVIKSQESLVKKENSQEYPLLINKIFLYNKQNRCIWSRQLLFRAIKLHSLYQVLKVPQHPTILIRSRSNLSWEVSIPLVPQVYQPLKQPRLLSKPFKIELDFSNTKTNFLVSVLLTLNHETMPFNHN